MMTVNIAGKLQIQLRIFSNILFQNRLYCQHHLFPVFLCKIHGKLHPAQILAALRAVHGQKSQPVFIRHLAVPFLVQLTGLIMKIVADGFSKMTAAGVNHHCQHPLIILLKLNKMISSAQSSDLKISGLQLSQKLCILLIQVQLFQCPVHGIRGHPQLMMGKAHGNISHNITDHRLDQRSVPGLDLPNGL